MGQSDLNGTSSLPVSRSELPSLEDLYELLQDVWSTRVFTNVGPIHQRFERALSEYLGTQNVTLVANATLGLMLSMAAIGDQERDEVITTPFTFVATPHAISWCGMKPVFVDLAPGTWCVEPHAIEAAITERTRAIVPVHCFGRVCDIESIQRIADRYGLPVIYDAAHAFGIEWKDRSVLVQGMASVVSFHASKAFHSCEGGAIVSASSEIKCRLDQMRNYGIVDDSSVGAVGLNAKMSELHAAVGLLQLRDVGHSLQRRREIAARYRATLQTIPWIQMLAVDADQTQNGAYFPVLIDRSHSSGRDGILGELRRKGIMARRYFWPLVSSLPMYRGLPSAAEDNLRVATDIAARVLCLPIYPTLGEADQDRVLEVLLERC